MRAGRWHGNGRQCRRPAVGGHRHGPCVQHQRQRPAHALVLELGVLVVEDRHHQRRVGMGVGEAGEPALHLRILLHDRERAFRRQVVHHVEIAVAHLDQAVVGGNIVAVDDEARLGFAHHAQCRLFPVGALFPDVPGAVRVERVQRIGPQAHRRIIGEGQDVVLGFHHVLGHDPGGCPAHREQRMEARIGLVEHEMHRVRIGGFDRFDLRGKRAVIRRAGCRLLLFHRIDHVVGREIDAVAPGDALLQFHRHFGEVVIVFPGAVGQRIIHRIVAGALDPRVGVDEPQRIGGQLVRTVGRAGARAHYPGIEPGRIADHPFGVVHDHRFIARELVEVGRRAFGLLRKRQTLGRQHQRTDGRTQHKAASIHIYLLPCRNASRVPFMSALQRP